MALKTVELMPSATSNSPFSLGRVKLWSRPEPNILKNRQQKGFFKLTSQAIELIHSTAVRPVAIGHVFVLLLFTFALKMRKVMF